MTVKAGAPVLVKAGPSKSMLKLKEEKVYLEDQTNREKSLRGRVSLSRVVWHSTKDIRINGTFHNYV